MKRGIIHRPPAIEQLLESTVVLPRIEAFPGSTFSHLLLLKKLYKSSRYQQPSLQRQFVEYS